MISKKNVFKFPHTLVDQPVMSHLVRQFDLDINILKASITPNEEGLMVLGLTGKKEAYDKAIKYLQGIGVKVEPFKHDIIRDEKRCTHCGACVVTCPSGSLVTDEQTKKINFIESKCIACELCVPVCPPRAMRAHY